LLRPLSFSFKKTSFITKEIASATKETRFAQLMLLRDEGSLLRHGENSLVAKAHCFTAKKHWFAAKEYCFAAMKRCFATNEHSFEVKAHCFATNQHSFMT